MAPEPLPPRRIQLQTLLEETSGLPESQVHFQPPTGTQMDHTQAVITYSRKRPEINFADNLPYHVTEGWTVTVIDKDPDNDVRSKIAALTYCSFDTWYANDGLNHYVFTLFF